ncbi:hypothetical protein IDF54_13895, partial [Flavobacterium sp. SaA2.13]|nr:hypothetical protein [Flavobacterium sp. SaA2.13]
LPALGQNGIIAPNAYCEENTDGFHTFILNEHTPAILGENVDPEDYTIRFYLDQAALDAGTALPNQYTNQVQGHQVILVWVRHDATGCINTASLDLYVEEAATANPTTQVFDECDYDGTNDGIYEFDLTLAQAEVLGGQNPADYSVTYYRTEADAINDENQIPNPSAYTNDQSPVDETIWIRVTNITTISGCYDLTTVNLHVEIIPEPVIQGGIICVDYDTQEVLNPVVMDTGLDDTHTFVWYLNGQVIPGATESVYVAEAVGSYSVEATNAAGCTSFPIDPVTVTQSGPAS